MRYITTVIAILSICFASAQQLPQYTQYFLNDYAINPAVAGLRDLIEIRSNNRYQWEGITDAPRTYTLSLNLPMPDEHFGVGAYLFTDIVGPTRRVGMQIGGAYRLQLNSDLELGVGVSVGMLEYSVDGAKIDLAQPGDGALANILGRTRVMDARAGIHLNAEDWYVGLSVPQIANNNVDLYSENTAGNSTLQTHLFLTAGYRYALSDDFMLEPNVMFKYVAPTPFKLDVSLRGMYKDVVWIGANYRNNDAVSAMVGFKVLDKILIAYSHDFSTTDIRNYSTGTHEVMLGLDVPKPPLD